LRISGKTVIIGSISNPNPERQRNEFGGFIVPDGRGGHLLQQLKSKFISDRGPCFIDFKTPKNLPEGSIYVHTHPYKNGEIQNECLPNTTLQYAHRPHSKDERAIGEMDVSKGIILDAQKIIIYGQNGIIDTFNRCGY
jgi:hypothetical protein